MGMSKYLFSPGTGTPNWKGGRTVASNGYVLLRRPGHPMADVRGYIYEHRLVMAESLGRSLSKREQVHHINGVKKDNRPENLELTKDRNHHAVLHRYSMKWRGEYALREPGEDNPLVVCRCGCGTEFERFDAFRRPRFFISGHNVTRDSMGRYAAR